MSFEELVLKILGNIFMVIAAVRAIGYYVKKEWGEMIGHVIFSVVLAGFIYFTDQTLGIFKFLWNVTFGAWFGSQVP